MRRLRWQAKTQIFTRWRTAVFVGVMLLLVILHYTYIFTTSVLQDPDRYLKSLTLTLDLPEGLDDADTQAMLYNHQLQKQLQQQLPQDVNLLMYQERLTNLKKTCKILGFTSDEFNIKQSSGDMWVVSDPPVFFCPVYKTGTTLWAKVLHVLKAKNPNINSPFQRYDNYGLQHYLTLKTELAQNNITSVSKEYLDLPMKFLFVRNPYSRVFSVYVDKVLAPNPYFWAFGARAIKKYRHSSVQRNQTSSNCGFDVTFKEFVKLVLEYKYLDRHVKPMHKICYACSIKYDVIGNLETFDQDVQYILDKSGVLGNRVKFQNFNFETRIDMILYQVIRAFMLEHAWKKCTDRDSALRRLWRQLQISGFIEKGHHYPLSVQESKNVTRIQFINMALTAFKQSTSGARRNKKEAYLQAYSQLSLAELEGLRHLYKEDFMLFGYYDRPTELFEMKRNFVKPNFDYFDVMGK